MTTTSPSLLDRLSAGTDQQSWDRFVELYTPLLFAWCKQVGTSDADAADLIQGVFLVLVEQLPRFHYDSNKSFRAWLKTILLNAWRNHLKKAGNQPYQSLDPLNLEDGDSFRLLEEAEYNRHLVHRALALMEKSFEPVTWKACLESIVHDRSAAEIARELGITVNAVYLAKSRVLRHLRQELQGFLD